MKKTLLMLCALPCLLSAQNFKINTVKDKSFVKQMIKDKQTEDRVFVYSNSENNLPDSIYAYYGEEKELVNKAAITYDDKGRRIQEKGVNLQYNEEYKIDYVYTQRGELIEEDVTTSYLINEEWVRSGKIVSIYNSADLYSPIEYYVYDYYEDNLVLDWSTIAIEFDDKERPIVYMDSTFILHDTFVMRLEMTYNEVGLYSLVTIFSPADAVEGEWEPREKIEFFYNEDNQLMSDVHYDYEYDWENDVIDWIYSYTYEYEYDEKGNRISEIERREYGVWEEIYYTNIYSSDKSANDIFFSVKSNVYPNPASDVLIVTLEGADNAVITLVNATGSIVVQQKTNQSTTSIPVQSLAKGYYFLTVQTSNGTKTHKVIIR